MATKLAGRGPIRLRRDEASDSDLETSSRASSVGDESASNDSADTPSNHESDNEAGLSEEEEESSHGGDPDDNENEEPSQGLGDVSFGLLAEAQERYAPPSRKRKLPGDFNEPSNDDAREDPAKAEKRREEHKRGPKNQRQSKHAPTVISSKQQVSRKRDVFDPSPAIKSRDPRFDPTIMSSNYSKNAVDKANKNYSFLTSYQAAEILNLKAQIKKSKDPAATAELKRKAMSIESKVRNAEARQRESKILTEHNQKEREAIRAGQKAKPYYLKPGELKKKAEEERVASMGKRARDKSEKRKKKREKSKDARNMPRVRREG